jgi:hypothetical protein
VAPTDADLCCRIVEQLTTAGPAKIDAAAHALSA